eukprot:TRINITY_DN10434_c0_g1_i1.p1 TRINITY_DN10434_c0_g1~~TRINITY_DN10434_c0_g1_i1.p1  ORF type:complete len:314 (+),score=82.12 TRINITY_DN10434_c0_g1_i1:87-1028(+)
MCIRDRYQRRVRGPVLAQMAAVYQSSRKGAERMAALASKARAAIAGSKRILIQADASVTTRSSGVGMALARTANLVEQAAHLHASGREITVMCGGASSVGRQILQTQNFGAQPSELPIPSRPLSMVQPYPEAQIESPSREDLAAIGIHSMNSVYDTMFKVYGIQCGHLQLSTPEINSGAALASINGLRKIRAVPMIASGTRSSAGPIKGFDSDSDSCAAALLAESLGCDLLVLLSQAGGAYTADPNSDDAQIVPVVNNVSDDLSIHAGLESKLAAAQYASSKGVPTVIADGFEWRSVLDVVDGKECGTIFIDI